jgi:hypothetical protein
MSVGAMREVAKPFYITELQGIKAQIQLPSPFECINQPKAGRAAQKEA